MSTQKTNSRKYELKVRAESQERTRRRIAKAAAELHGEVGPAKTAVTEIARRAGVSRLTVYKHFPDNAALYPACSEHHLSEHPLPDFEAALAPKDPGDRLRSVLGAVYGWYRGSSGMVRNVQRDRGTDPDLDAVTRATLDAALVGLADELVTGFGPAAARANRLRSMIGIALHFWTWDQLAGDGFDDEQAAALMTDAVAAVADASPTAR
jgi:AcrR family transcriptional regulator